MVAVVLRRCLACFLCPFPKIICRLEHEAGGTALYHDSGLTRPSQQASLEVSQHMAPKQFLDRHTRVGCVVLGALLWNGLVWESKGQPTRYCDLPFRRPSGNAVYLRAVWAGLLQIFTDRVFAADAVSDGSKQERTHLAINRGHLCMPFTRRSTYFQLVRMGFLR